MNSDCKHPSTRAGWAIVVPTLLAFAIRFYGLGDKPLWLDEVFTHGRAARPLYDLIQNSFSNHHFPTYFLLIKPIAPSLINEWVLRAPSAVFGTLVVLLVARIAVELWSSRAGMIAGLLAAVSPFEVQLAQEARPYALLSCLVLLALWGELRIIRHFQGARPIKAVGVLPWVAYVLGTAGALNVQLVAVPWLLVSNVIYFCCVPKGQASATKAWWLAQSVILLTWLPLLTALVLWNEHIPALDFAWIPPSTASHLWRVLSAVYLFRTSDVSTFELFPAQIPGFGLLIASIAVLGSWSLRNAKGSLLPLTFTLLSLPGLLALTSIVHPAAVPRYLAWSTGPLFVLAGIGATIIPRSLALSAPVALGVAGLYNLAPYYTAETKPRWDLAAAYLGPRLRADDLVVTNGAMAQYVLTRYGNRYNLDKTSIRGRMSPSDVEAARVWVVSGRTGQSTEPDESAFEAEWNASEIPSISIRLGSHVSVQLFERNISTNESK
jgi:mannosyltransferase